MSLTYTQYHILLHTRKQMTLYIHTHSLSHTHSHTHITHTHTQLRHPNLCLFLGLAEKSKSELCVVSEYMARGTLYDFLHLSNKPLSWHQVCMCMCVRVCVCVCVYGNAHNCTLLYTSPNHTTLHYTSLHYITLTSYHTT
jgi:hypothetical protein